jgi:hypothetical protein
MKYIGMLLLITGLILIGIGLTMDTTVEVGYDYENTLNLPDRVYNIGLLAERQNYLIFGGVLTVLGIITVLYYDTPTNKIKLKKCPKCAEMVNDEAMICRYCKHEFVCVLDDDEDNSDFEIDEEAERIRKNLSNGIFK